MSNHPAAQYLRGQLQQKFAEGGAFGDDCKNVLWTAGCTFASPQAGHAGCGVVLGTLACTLAAHGQQAAQGAVGADCKNVMWTAGCTFAGQQQGGHGGGGFGCIQITATTFCTVGTQVAAQGQSEGAVGCVNLYGTLACTLQQGPQAAQGGVGEGCKNVMWTRAAPLRVSRAARAAVTVRRSP